jgi:IS5 family transposase
MQAEGSEPMLRERYEPSNIFERIPSLAMRTDPVLAHIDTLLDDDTIFQAVKADLSTRFPRTTTDGRPSTPVEVILRMLVVKHLHNWSFPQTSQFVSDSLVLRQFCRVYFEAVPDQSTLNRWARLIQPATLHRLLDHVVHLATQHQVTYGRKLRVDGTVVETTIHHPSDSTLLNDGVRVLSRTLLRARQVVADALAVAQQAFVDPTQHARARMKQIMYVARLKGEQAADQLKTAYRDLVDLTHTVVEQAQQVASVLQEQTGTAAERVATTLETVIPRVQQVIAQTTRRVLQGEAVPAREKIVSLFEPHTAILRKGKAGKPTEFGREVWLDEVDGGIITRYAILEGNPDEKAQLLPSIDHHKKQFGQPPELVTADRGVQSAANERDASAAGVREIVLPKPGKKSAKRTAYERQEWFVAGRNWRAGIEGRISDLKRRHGLNRCRYHGADGMERWVGFGILAHNLRIIARHQVA